MNYRAKVIYDCKPRLCYAGAGQGVSFTIAIDAEDVEEARKKAEGIARDRGAGLIHEVYLNGIPVGATPKEPEKKPTPEDQLRRIATEISKVLSEVPFEVIAKEIEPYHPKSERSCVLRYEHSLDKFNSQAIEITLTIDGGERIRYFIPDDHYSGEYGLTGAAEGISKAIKNSKRYKEMMEYMVVEATPVVSSYEHDMATFHKHEAEIRRHPERYGYGSLEGGEIF